MVSTIESGRRNCGAEAGAGDPNWNCKAGNELAARDQIEMRHNNMMEMDGRQFDPEAVLLLCLNVKRIFIQIILINE